MGARPLLIIQTARSENVKRRCEMHQQLSGSILVCALSIVDQNVDAASQEGAQTCMYMFETNFDKVESGNSISPPHLERSLVAGER